MNYFRFKLGCDPELFLSDREGNLKASCGLIGGTKEAPQPLPMLGEGFAVQEDNVAMEFNIPPAATMREFVDSITRTIKVLGDGINDTLGFHIDVRSCASFPEEELQHEQARVFGCDPDFNAWTGEKNPKPEAADKNLRSCGGHVHVGFENGQVDKKRLIKCMDLTLGVPATIMDAKGAERRRLYGKRGAYRDKPYGVEYRVLSNFWVHHPKLIEWTWKQTAEAIAFAKSAFNVDSYDKEVEKAINEGSREHAWQVIRDLGLEVVHV
jgi:hypothetical protein